MGYPAGVETPPVACTLRPRELADRRQAWQQLLEGWLLQREATPEGGSLILSPAPGVARAARELAELEAECCPWMRIEVEEAGQVILHLRSSQPTGPQTIREMFAVPESAGPDDLCREGEALQPGPHPL